MRHKFHPSFKVDNEIEILSTLSHTNIIAFYNHFADDKSIYIEMEFAEGMYDSTSILDWFLHPSFLFTGGSLQHQISDRLRCFSYYTQEEVVWLFYQILRGLNYMHSLKIMHRFVR